MLLEEDNENENFQSLTPLDSNSIDKEEHKEVAIILSDDQLHTNYF